MSRRDERSARADFAERYALVTGDANARIERDVIGAVWGANGYTTVAQADELGRRLELGAGSRLLDVGAGRGWPGLYLARQTGCSVVSTDMPVEGLAIAARRARAEGIGARSSLVAAAGAAQPFRPGSFDAVVLTDVLC
jgi:2-polyprenyl-3-methyl-5-hydroxy-6-metoxy-1,4-benzoquinol methylase